LLDNYSNNTAVFAKAIYAASNLSRWIIPDMKMNLAFANLSLDRAMSLTENLSDAAHAAKQKIGEANEALKRKSQARDAAAYFINVSLNESAEASKAMTLMSDPGSNVSADYVANLTSSAKAAAAKAGELSERQVQAEIEHKAATIESQALATKEYLIARAIAVELQSVLTRVARSLDGDATEVNRTLGFFNSSVRRSMEDALKDHRAPGLFPTTVNISIAGDNFTKAMRVLEKAGIDVQGIQASLLQIAAASNRTEAKPGNVTVNITVESGNETLLRNISTMVSERLRGIFSSKAAFNVSYDVHRIDTGGEIIIHAIVPDVTSKTVKMIVNSTQTAIQDVMGKSSDEEAAEVGIGVVGSNGSKTLEEVDNMTGVVGDAEMAGEIVFGKPKAPAAGKNSKVSYSRLALTGIFVLVILGLLVICCNRFGPSREA